MTAWWRGSISAAGIAGLAVVLAACQSTGTSTANLNTIGSPQQLQPVPNSTVSQNQLPAIGATGTPAPGLSGQPVLGGVPPTPAGQQVATLAGPGGATTQMTNNGSFATVGAPGQPTSISVNSAAGVPTGPEGVWNVTAAGATCRLNLPLTSKTGTSYYRASAPGCTVPQLASVTGWQQVGSQLQLYDENGNIAAFLAPSSGRYIGTMGGGQPVSMQR